MAREEAVKLLADALRSGDTAAFDALQGALAPDVEFSSSQVSPPRGPDAVVAELQALAAAGRFSRSLDWTHEAVEGGSFSLTATQPPEAQYAAYVWDLMLDDAGKVRGIAQRGLPHASPLPPSPVALDDHIDHALKHAFEVLNPMIVAYVDEKGRPVQSPRGTVQVLSETQLAMWLWSRNGGIVRGVAKNPEVSVHYWGGIGTPWGGTVLFQGTANIDDTEATRDFVYGNAPPSEQRADPNREGCALVLDLHRVTGFVAGFRYNMQNPEA